MTRFAPVALFLSFIAYPAVADQPMALSTCQSGPNDAVIQTEAELAQMLAGNWLFVAPGTGFTIGTTQIQVTLAYDPALNSLTMGGGNGPTLQLTPASSARATDGTQRDDTPFDVSVDALTRPSMSADEIEALAGCAAPLRYWWQFQENGNRSWGALMFYTPNSAVGFMANSARGSRDVYLTR